MFGLTSTAIDRARTKPFSEGEVLDLFGWTSAQLDAARALGLSVNQGIVSRTMADDPRVQVATARRVHGHELVHWLERLQAIGVERIGRATIADLLG